MAVSININGLSLVHKDSGGVAKATLPGVCYTPTSNGPVPINYSNTAYSRDLADGPVTVFADGGHMCANKGSQFSKSTGDEAGSLGGVVSGTHMAEATWLTYSPNVILEGENACRLTDKMFMNHYNTVCAAGVINPPLPKPPDDPKCKRIYERIFDALYATKKGKWGGKRGLVERWAQYAQKNSRFGPRPDGSNSTRMENHINEYRKGQDNLREELKSWDSNKSNCDDKSGDGGGEVLEKARAYVENEPEYGSGIMEPPKSTAIDLEAAGKAAVGTGAVVGGIIIITRIIRCLPPLWPLQLSPL